MDYDLCGVYLQSYMIVMMMTTGSWLPSTQYDRLLGVQVDCPHKEEVQSILVIESYETTSFYMDSCLRDDT